MDELKQRVDFLRIKSLREALTLEEAKEAVRLCREVRGKMASPRAEGSKSAKGAPKTKVLNVSSLDLLKGLKGA